MEQSIARFSNFVSELHEQTQTQNRFELVKWATEDLAQQLSFDSAWYGWADISSPVVKIHSAATLNLPCNFYDVWQIMSHEDILAKQMVEEKVKVSTYERDGSRQSDGMIMLADKFNLKNILTVSPSGDLESRLFFMSAYRASDNNRSWEQADREYLKCAADHLLKALRYGYQERTSSNAVTILMNDSGVVLFGLKSLKEKFGHLFEHCTGSVLPLYLLESARVAGTHLFPEREVAMDVDVPGQDDKFNLHRVHIRKMDNLDLLSKREIQVARVLANGKSHKEVARVLNISPSTVRNHTQTIYDKLEIDNRASLSRLIQQRQHRTAS